MLAKGSELVDAEDIVVVLDELEFGGVPGGGGFDFGEDGGDGGGFTGSWEAGAVARKNLGEGEAATLGNGGGDFRRDGEEGRVLTPCVGCL